MSIHSAILDKPRNLVINDGRVEHKYRDEDPDPDPVIFGPPDPDPVLFSTDPDPDPTCNIGLIKYFYLEQNINQNQQIQA